jgi:hypothetical protein
MPSPYAVAAFSMLGGWLLAQLAAPIRDFVYRRWIRRAVVDELVQLGDELKRLQMNYARSIQISALPGIEPSIPLPLSNHIFANHYKDAVLAFTRVQRIAVQMIHAYVRELNLGAESLRNETEEKFARIRKGEKLDLADFDEFGNRVKCQYRMVQTARWHINHYLEHEFFPSLEPHTDEHKSYLKFLDEVEADISQIEKSCNGIRPEQFNVHFIPPQDPIVDIARD